MKGSLSRHIGVAVAVLFVLLSASSAYAERGTNVWTAVLEGMFFFGVLPALILGLLGGGLPKRRYKASLFATVGFVLLYCILTGAQAWIDGGMEFTSMLQMEGSTFILFVIPALVAHSLSFLVAALGRSLLTRLRKTNA